MVFSNCSFQLNMEVEKTILQLELCLFLVVMVLEEELFMSTALLNIALFKKSHFL